ncbi:MAG: CHAD domain-containing protein [Flavobacteriales bacterium]
MDGNSLRKGFEKKYKKYFGQALKVKVHFREKDIHEMRISLKKLQAYAAFIHELTKGKSEEVIPIASIQSVFQTAGKLRNAQINIQLMEGKKISKKTGIFYETEISRLVKSFIRTLKREIKPTNIELKKSDCKNIKKLVSDYSRKQVNLAMQHYVSKRWKEIDKYIQSKNVTKAMHEVRIRLKHMEAVTELLNQPKVLGVQSERLKGIMQEIGEWHDSAVFADSLKAVNKQANKKHSKEKAELFRLRIKMDKENKSYAKDILRSLRELKNKKPRRER